MTNQKQKTLRVLDPANCTFANLRKASRTVSQAYDDALRPAGLKATQFTLLATLNKRGEVSVSELAAALVMDRTTLTRNLKPLENRGLVATAPGQDRRVRQIALTEAGRETFNTALQHWKVAQRRLVNLLGDERWVGLLGDLRTVVDLTHRA